METILIDILRTASDWYYNTEDYYELTNDEMEVIRQELQIPVQPLMTDAMYDSIYTRVKQLYPSNPFFLSVGAEVRGDKVLLPIPLGSMTEAKLGEMSSWMVAGKYCISDKLDGISCLLAYENGKLKIAYTRGDGYEGQDITRHVRKLPTCPTHLFEPFTGYVRGEIIIPKDKIEETITELSQETKKEYKNGRNLCAGQLNAKECSNIFAGNAHFVAYYIDGWKEETHKMFEKLQSLRFLTPVWRISDRETMTDEYLTKTLQKVKLEGKYECDGIICTLENIDDDHQGFETGTLNPKASRKFKISGLDETFTSTITSITWQISKDSLLKPVINITPVNHNGVTISNITGNNYKFVMDNHLTVGSVIKGKRSGYVIPQFVSMVTTNDEGDDLFCLDQYKGVTEVSGVELEYIGDDVSMLKEVSLQKTVYFCSKLGVEFGGYGNIKKLLDYIETDTITYENLCTLPMDVFVETIGVNGIKFYNSLHKQVKEATPTQLADATGCFGRGIGELKLNKIVDKYGSLVYDGQKVYDTEGWAQKTSSQYMTKYVRYAEMVAFFQTHGMWKGFEQTISTSDKYKDVKVCFTGVRNGELEEIIRKNGGKVLTSVTKECNLVVAKDPNSSSGKAAKARSQGIEIITLDQAFERFGHRVEKTSLEGLDNPLANLLK